MQKTFTEQKAYLENMSDQELVQFHKEISSTTFTPDSIARKVVIDIFGQVDILALQVNQLVGPLLAVAMERMSAYSPHINSKNTYLM